MPYSILPDDHWVILEHELREALKGNRVADRLWLVYDLLVAIRVTLVSADLVTWTVARKYFQMFPDQLAPICAVQPTPPDQPPTAVQKPLVPRRQDLAAVAEALKVPGPFTRPKSLDE